MSTTKTPEEIRAFRRDNPKMRERDIAATLGISEAALVAAETGLTATRISPAPDDLLAHAEGFGEIMALSRNESAVHEKIGVFENIKSGKKSAIVLGENIDLRIFPSRWTHAFAVTKTDADGNEKLSLQYFDASGTAVFKVHWRPKSNVEAYHRFVEAFKLDDTSQTIETREITAHDADHARDPQAVDVELLRDRWTALTDTHQFFGMLNDLKVHRQTAISTVGDDYAFRLADDAAATLLHKASENAELPIMVFVNNNGIVQIHSGPVKKIVEMGPWINVMDPTFHLHLRRDQIAETWLVRKPTSDGHVTSVEAFNAAGEMIIQFFGKRLEGYAERPVWRELAESLPRHSETAAA
ncbi:ChuX/HutX family heme-like substrate-binding protein [uncultured Martelella sp.]|uniref:hemin-degrading factor n=1 Tax=uncultured Martelella sp. TaxID=392331 RepID=UPI0029C8B332|nr:ChuX/HutX family heme-like substrate-binding protein [uncultured Martelella sp.]